MKIVVLLKEVPDTYADRKLSLETGRTDRGASEAVADEIGERALELALTHADLNPGTEVVVLTMGPESAVAVLRKGLSMGADSAAHVHDAGLSGADLGTTARTLTAAIRRLEPDVVLAGNLSTDGSGGVMAAMVAELLGMPNLTSLGAVELSDRRVSGRRLVEGGSMSVSAPLPAVVSITEELPDARFPNFKGILSAKKKPLDTWTLADLGLDGTQAEVSRSIVVGIRERAARAAGVKIIDEGDAAERLAEFLVSNRLA
ncbi:MAG: electron transfer flavoprotein subunit beta/FixA family protein [Microbacterium sp.]|jgi:electron transfer flavoprotein beta subunit|uniref:electron transfer flavoprotein subunit beta/FixA family protein n=1 Tax=Microbacterium sp. TaxID=51671 RepID=UPI002728A866|nr:electron transfer flavoprotein subunit beta/FixA family protein [Microbacterium sp.]MDO8381497.1 electron transfer flavoprotein subunit beta/FixA family protein [Microbacterium sp.]